MKAIGLFSMLFALMFSGQNANAFTGHEEFKIDLVKPWGEFGFRALGKGKNLTEMRFDCSKASEMGLVVTSVNSYGKSNYIVLPAGRLGPDKKTCQENLKKYFANVYSKRGLASARNFQRPRVNLNIVRSGLFSDTESKKTLSFH